MLKAIATFTLLCLITGCNTVETDAKSLNSSTMRASWYQHGKRTANGERFIPDGYTTAHKTLPFGTNLELTHNGKSVRVRVNDRGPFIKGKDLDLSRGAAKALGCIEKGSCIVAYRIL